MLLRGGLATLLGPFLRGVMLPCYRALGLRWGALASALLLRLPWSTVAIALIQLPVLHLGYCMAGTVLSTYFAFRVEPEPGENGRRAGEELGIRAPLMEAGLTKDEIRQLSGQRGLDTAEAPSRTCWASALTLITRPSMS